MRLSEKRIAGLKVLLFLAGLLPLASLASGAFFFPQWLGPNPAETITRSTGDWTLRLLLLTLTVTPLRRMTGWIWLLRFRRMLGLFAFFYALLHVSSYVSFDHVFDIGEIIKDVIKRPFITVGFAALVLMTPLAITSTRGWVMRLGGPRWQNLHRLVYAVAVFGVVHYWWLVKRDITEPLIYAAILAALLGYRLIARARKTSARGSGSPSAR